MRFGARGEFASTTLSFTSDWLVEKMEGTRHELNVKKIAALMDLEKRAELGDRSKRIPF